MKPAETTLVATYAERIARPASARRGLASRLAACALASLTGFTLAHADAPRAIDVNEYRVEGVSAVSPVEIERAVLRHLGPSRTGEDIEAARAAVEKVYHDKGYQSVSVTIPPQTIDGGVVTLVAEEARVGRLRVRGSRYHDPKTILDAVPSLAEGKVPDFNAVQREIVALQGQDLKVLPALKPGVTPGTVDVDLTVEDKAPLHGSLELNNRRNPDTTALRLNGDLHYDNLWQAGHGLGASFQTAPENTDDSLVYSAYYLARIRRGDPLALMLSGTKQDSDVNTLGSFNVSGRGEVVGLRALIDLTGNDAFVHSASFGIEYKNFDTALSGGGGPAVQTPITYYPFSAGYNATRLWKDESVTQGSLGATWHLRGMGDDEATFESKRAGASGGFLYFRGELSHLQKLPDDFELYLQAQGQASQSPLVSNEQFGIGGLSSARGYFESETLGDTGLALTAEVRTPSFTCGGFFNEWRLHAFVDWAGALVSDAGAGQQSRFELASAGVGTRAKLLSHLSGSLDLAVPLLDGPRTESGDLAITFTLRAEF